MVGVADINTGEYFRNQRVRRFHDTYHNETVIVNVGVVGKRWADKLLVGITLRWGSTGPRFRPVHG